MPLPIPARSAPADGYRPPALLQDIRLLDLLELSGTTLEASRLLKLSQPTVSRRYRALAEDFALVQPRRCLSGCVYGTTPVLRWLRLGSRAHRLAAGVARIGSDVLLQPLLLDCPWQLPSPPRFRRVESWCELVRQGVLDGALVSGLELSDTPDLERSGLDLLPLGEIPLSLVCTSEPAGPLEGTDPLVLVPNRGVAGGLLRELQARGLTLRTAGNNCQSPAQWLHRLERGGLAMALPDLAPAHWWTPLQRLALSAPLAMPVWLVLPEGWREEAVLVHIANALTAIPAPGSAEGS